MVWLGYLALLLGTALLTGYTRNHQATIALLSQRTGEADGGLLTPRAQHWRNAAMLAAWMACFLVSFVFFAYWKAMVALVGTFLVGLPLMASFTPRKGSAHYVRRLRDGLIAKRAAMEASGGPRAKVERARLDAVLERLKATDRLA